jgi:predicted metal-dependent hydrolase
MPNIDIPYTISYRNIKYPRLEFRTGMLLLVLPRGSDPESIITKHQEWINKKCKFIEECLKEAERIKLHSQSEDEFKDIVYSLAERSAEELNVEINNIFFRTMKTKWASCSTKKNLTINRLMRYLPEHLLEYIIFHEIVHLFEKQHNDRFWEIVAGEYPAYEEIEKDLFVYWFRLVGHDPRSCL